VVNTTTAIQNETKTDESIFCFPNPFHKSIYINGKGKFEYSIYDLAGNEVESDFANGSIEEGLTLNSGIYFVKIQNEKETRTSIITKQ